MRTSIKAVVFLTILITFLGQNLAYGNNDPVFTEDNSAKHSVAENSATGTNIGTPVSATDADNDTLTYTLSGNPDAAAFSIVRATGQLQTNTALDFETQSSYSVTVSVSDSNGGSDTIDVTIKVTNVNEAPVISEGDRTTRTVAENIAAGRNIGAAFTAIDPDSGDTLTYSLHRGDRDAFQIDPNTGQVQTKAALDYETKSSYTDLAVRVTDSSGLTDAILVTINVTDGTENNAPVFTEGARTTRSVAENTPARTNIGAAISATDPDSGDTLTYSLHRGDRDAFQIDPNTGQVQTKTALDYETKNAYTDLAVRVTDSSGITDAILITINVTDVTENRAPVFTDGTSATRAIAENTTSGQNIGTTVAATDADNDTLTYTLGGTDASAFSVVSTTGQLQTRAALDYETKTSYSVTLTVSDGSLTDSIDVTINVTDVAENNAPVFTDGDNTTRVVAENTTADTNIGRAVSATDADNDTLTYTLGGTDAASFRIVKTSGQLQTNAALDYETKVSYSVIVSVLDGNGGSDRITVTINVKDVAENNAPVFTAGDSTTRTIAENTASGQNIGTAVAATDADTGDTLTYTLDGTDASAFSIVSTTGQLQTNAALDYETDDSYSVTVSVSDGDGDSDSILVTINVSNINEAPSFTDGDSTTRTIAENTVSGENIGTAVAATDVDANTTLTYTLDGTDASAFSIVSTTGQLQTRAALDYETKDSYSVTVSASDGDGGSDSIPITISVSNVNEAPSFTDGDSTTRTIAENTVSGENIGDPVAATDVDADTTLAYTLGGTDAAAFSIVRTTGQLQTSGDLNFETKPSYSVHITASDGTLTDRIDVTISVSNVNEAPSFTDGDSTTRTIAENTVSGENIGMVVAATDVDANTTLTYTLGGTDASSFRIVSTTGQLQTRAALDYETKKSYLVTISVSDGNGGSDSIPVTISVSNVNEAPNFTDGSSATRTIAENTAANTNIGPAVAATDVDANTTLTYTLGGTDASSFRIVNTTGQLQTRAALDYETKKSYSVTVSASDGDGGSDSIPVTISVSNVNEAPNFTEGSSTTRSIAENTESRVRIGTPIVATDADSDPLTYNLSGPDAAAFTIGRNSGQLKTKTKTVLDYETKAAYTVTVTAADGNGGTASITVIVNVTNVNDTPVFTEGSSTTRAIAENTASGSNIGAPIIATDPDGDTITYSLGGVDASAFTIDSTTGQLQTSAALNYETKSTYTVTVTAADGKGGTASITGTVNVTNTNEAPMFVQGNRTTRSIAENTASGSNIGAPIIATDPDGDSIRYRLGGEDSSYFTIEPTTGQLQIRKGIVLDYETQSSTYIFFATASDSSKRSSITVTVYILNVDEPGDSVGNIRPAFQEGFCAIRSIAENTASGTNIGAPIVATDPDGDSITYRFGHNSDADYFTVDANTGQLKTKAPLNYESVAAYLFRVFAYDGNGGSGFVDVRINVINVIEPGDPVGNSAPVFTEGSLTARSIAENTASGTNIGAPIIATDPDGDTIRYRLGGVDASAFTIDSTTGQLQIKKVPDYETQLTTYIFFVTAFDGYNRSSITVAVYIQNVDEPGDPESPGRNIGFAFKEGNNTTRSIPENAASGTNIGEPVVAPDTGATTYRFGRSPDTAYFTVDANTGQLQTKAPLNYWKRSTYMVTVIATDGNGNIANIRVRVDVTKVFEEFINVAPVFTDGSSTTRSVAENTASSTNIGSAVAATDADGDGITYSLGGTDAGSFSIDSGTGQLQTNAALDYEEKSTYTVTVTVDDGWGGGASIAVTINVADVNEAPVFTEGSSTTRQVPVGSPINTHVGSPVSATDPEGRTITYSLGGTDADKFSIDSSTGQIKVAAKFTPRTIPLQVGQAPLQFVVTITATDDTVTDTIKVTITGTHPQQAPTSQRAPTKTVLLPNYPNPFNPETWIPYQLSKSAQVTLTIYNVKGERVRQFALGHQSAGSYRSKSRAIHWDGRNQFGEKVATGVYFYQFTAGSFTATRRMLIIK